MKIVHVPPKAECLAGFGINDTIVELHKNSNYTISEYKVNCNETDNILIFNNYLSNESVNQLISIFKTSGIEASVSVNGLKNENFGVGSKRYSCWSENIASELTNLIIPELKELKCNDYTSTDFWQPVETRIISRLVNNWTPIEISPLIRFMRYDSESEHYTHYDAGFFYNEQEYRTLKSFVIYLTTNEIGSTRFIKDDQQNIEIWKRNHNDWTRRVKFNEIILESHPIKGNILIFNHRLPHDVEQYFPSNNEESRMIIRGDIIYQPTYE